MTEKKIQIQVWESRPTPGLTLQSLSFQNFSNQIQKNNKKFLLKNIEQNVFIIFYSLFRIWWINKIK